MLSDERIRTSQYVGSRQRTGGRDESLKFDDSVDSTVLSNIWHSRRVAPGSTKRGGEGRMSAKRSQLAVGGRSSSTVVPAREPRWELNSKALATKQLILDSARALFLEQGYAGTRIEHIASACGLSRGALYAYFGSKREIFETLGTSTYKSQMTLIGRLADLPTPCDRSDVQGWVGQYFDFMAEHGAFMLSSAQGGPQEPEFRERVLALTVRTAQRLGQQIARHSGRSTRPDVAQGLLVMATLERTWFYVYGLQLPVNSDEVLEAATGMLYLLLEPAQSGSS
jgi:AcrR family transcriptional regulator